MDARSLPRSGHGGLLLDSRGIAQVEAREADEERQAVVEVEQKMERNRCQREEAAAFGREEQVELTIEQDQRAKDQQEREHQWLPGQERERERDGGEQIRPAENLCHAPLPEHRIRISVPQEHEQV